MFLMIDRLILSRPESRRASFRSSESGQRRDCVICSVPLSLHSTNPTDSPRLASRLEGQCFYYDAGASGGVTAISRIKAVCPPPAADYVLAPCGICGQFSHLQGRCENRPQTPQAKEDTYARKWVRSTDGITRPEGTSGAINLYRNCMSVVMPFYCPASYVYKTYMIDLHTYRLTLTDRLCSLERCPLTASMRKYLMCTWYSCSSSPDVAL